MRIELAVWTDDTVAVEVVVAWVITVEACRERTEAYEKSDCKGIRDLCLYQKAWQSPNAGRGRQYYPCDRD